MSLSLDENLSSRLTARLGTLFPGIIHVRDVGLSQAPDQQIWEWARENGYTLVSADADFVLLAERKGPKPKLIHLERYDFPFRVVEEMLRRNAIRISEFERAPADYLLIILSSSIQGFR